MCIVSWKAFFLCFSCYFFITPFPLPTSHGNFLPFFKGEKGGDHQAQRPGKQNNFVCLYIIVFRLIIEYSSNSRDLAPR